MSMDERFFREGDVVVLDGEGWREGNRVGREVTLGGVRDAGGRLVVGRKHGADYVSHVAGWGATLAERDGKRVANIYGTKELTAISGEIVIEYADGSLEHYIRGAQRHEGCTLRNKGTFVRDGFALRWTPRNEHLAKATDEEIDAALARVKKKHGLCGTFDTVAAQAKEDDTYLKRLQRAAVNNSRMVLYDDLVRELSPKREWKVGEVVPQETVIDVMWAGVYEGTRDIAAKDKVVTIPTGQSSIYERRILWIKP